jgi:hypothetical protein
VKNFDRIMIINIFIWPIIGIILYFMQNFDPNVEKIYLLTILVYFTIFIPAVLDTISVFVLYDAFKRISDFTKNSSPNLFVN